MPRRVKPSTKYPQDVVDRIVALAKQGMLHRDIAAEVGRPRSTVSEVCRKAGLRRMKDMTKIPNLAIVRAYELGATAAELSAKVDVRPETLRKILVAYKVPLRKGGFGCKHADDVILKLYRRGCSCREIAARLGHSRRWIEHRLKRLKERLGL